MKQKQILKYLQILAGLVFIVQCSSAFGAQTSLFPVGSQFPKFTLGAPDSPEAQKYLGLERNEPFTLSNIRAKIVLIEFLEAFWPVCAKNAPVVNRLYQLIQDDPALARDIKIIGIACLDDKKKADAYKTLYRVPFPIFTDEKGDIWRAVGMPGTPTMVLVTPGGKVLTSHVGVIQDFDAYVKEMKELHKNQ